MENYTIGENVLLPSGGSIYSRCINPNLKLRSMTVEEEMKRLGQSELPYQIMSEIIDDCIIDNKPDLKAYDMSIADYQYLLYQLRIITYGKDYKVNTLCPFCGNINNESVDLNKLEVIPYSNKLDKYLKITLPVSKDEIELNIQTPRMMDSIIKKSNDLKAKIKNITGDPTFLYSLEALISKINGVVYDPIKLDAYVRKMSAADSNYIIKAAKKLSDGFGIDTNIKCKCSKCKQEFKFNLPITGEFFGPDID